MTDEELAHLIARDLASYVQIRGADLDGPVYALALFVEDLYAEFYASIATEPGFERVRESPAHLGWSEEIMRGPAGTRWNSGDWEVCAERFLADDTEQALRPLSVLVRDDGFDLDDSVTEAARARWGHIGYRALDLAQPLTLLSTTPNAIAFVEFAETNAVEVAESMLRSTPVTTFHAVFPQWRRMAEAVRSVRADPEKLHELEGLTDLLRACGLYGLDVTEGNDTLRRALAVAERDL